MTAFDAEISVYSATVSTPDDEAIDSGAPPQLEFGIVAAMALPFPNPETGQPLAIPLGRFRFVFAREQAIQAFEMALKAAKELPEQFVPSGRVATARSMADVENAAKGMHKMTGL